MRGIGITGVLVVSACLSDMRPPAIPRVSLADAGFIQDSVESLGRFLEARAADGVFPGGVLALGRRGGLAYVRPVGVYGEDDPDPVTDATIYDLASLTKVVGLTSAAFLLLADGRLDLEERVSTYLPEFGGPGKSDVTVRHLLTHTSGLPPWIPLHLETDGPQTAIERVLAEDLESDPGSQYAYSDLGAIVMTQVVERVAGEPLDVFLERRLFGPLGMRDTRFRPPPAWVDRIAPTERDAWRGRLVRGEVHDENAFHLGGVSGHAGLFSSALDLSRFALWILDAYHDRLGGREPTLPADLVRSLVAVQPGPAGSTRAIGWDTPTPGGGASSGRLLSPASFGHTGFTGTSIWIDTERDLFIILLTNRVHPTRENRALLPLRGEIADMVIRALAP
jgi:CubicO group peptidase (beta-lactamase class C family)